MLRRASNAVSISRLSQSLGSPQRSSAEGVSKTRKCALARMFSRMTLLKVTAGDALKVEKRVIAVMGQVMEDSQRPGGVGAPVTDKHGFLDAAHVRELKSGRTWKPKKA